MLLTEPHEPLPPRDDDHTSQLLRRVIDGIDGETVTVGYLIVQLRRRSFGGIMIVLAILAMLPGISFFAGIAMMVPALQMTLGLRAPALPDFIARQKIKVAVLRTKSARVLPWVEKVEFYIRPRWVLLSRPPMPMLIGLLSFALALAILLPLPLANLLPALALLVLSLGLLEKDGIMIALGLVLTALACALALFMGAVLIEAVTAFLS